VDDHDVPDPVDRTRNDERPLLRVVDEVLATGAGDMISVYIRQVLVQLETPDAIRGRVSSVSSMFIGSSNTLGEFESGATARWFGPVLAVALGGIATLAVVGGYLKLFPELRSMDRFRRKPPV